jgi:hypothetical protein
MNTHTEDALGANFFVDIYEGPYIGWESRNSRDRDLNLQGMTEQEVRATVEGERRPWRAYQEIGGEIIPCGEGGQSESDADHGEWLARVPQ